MKKYYYLALVNLVCFSLVPNTDLDNLAACLKMLIPTPKEQLAQFLKNNPIIQVKFNTAKDAFNNVKPEILLPVLEKIKEAQEKKDPQAVTKKVENIEKKIKNTFSQNPIIPLKYTKQEKISAQTACNAFLTSKLDDLNTIKKELDKLEDLKTERNALEKQITLFKNQAKKFKDVVEKQKMTNNQYPKNFAAKVVELTKTFEERSKKIKNAITQFNENLKSQSVINTIKQQQEKERIQKLNTLLEEYAKSAIEKENYYSELITNLAEKITDNDEKNRIQNNAKTIKTIREIYIIPLSIAREKQIEEQITPKKTQESSKIKDIDVGVSVATQKDIKKLIETAIKKIDEIKNNDTIKTEFKNHLKALIADSDSLKQMIKEKFKGKKNNNDDDSDDDDEE